MRVALTQRVDPSETGERRDALDQRWTLLLDVLGWQPVPLCNTIGRVREYLQTLCPDAVILTGGNDLSHLPGASNSAPERDRFETGLLRFCEEEGIPVLGVCRGMQMINVHRGGRLEPCRGHVATRHRVVGEGGSFEVNSFHGYGIPPDGLGEGLDSTFVDEDGQVEGFRHRTLSWTGVMWHPEREEPHQQHDLDLLRSALSKGDR